MAISTQIQNLNLIPGKSAPVVVHLSQGNVGNTVKFYLYDGDNPYYPTNVSIAVHGVRADGSVFGPYTVSTTSSSNLVSFNIVTAMTSVNGAAIGELVLTDSNQNQIGSANFGMLVEAAPYSSSVTYEEDLSIYQRILAYVQSIPAELRNEINTERDTRAAAINNLQTQINQIIAPSGEAPSAAEVQNARIGADGTVYDTLGSAIRGQITDLKSGLDTNIKSHGENLAAVGTYTIIYRFINVSSSTLGADTKPMPAILIEPNSLYAISCDIVSHKRVGTSYGFAAGVKLTSLVDGATDNKTIYIRTNDTDKYLFIQLYTDADTIKDASQYYRSLSVVKIEDYQPINDTPPSEMLENAYINANDGSFSTADSTITNVTLSTRYFINSKIKAVWCDSPYKIAYCQYKNDDADFNLSPTYVGQSDLSSLLIIPDNSLCYRITIKYANTGETATMNSSDVISHIHFVVGDFDTRYGRAAYFAPFVIGKNYYPTYQADFSEFDRDTTTAELYSKIDSLISQSNGYITKTNLGVCSDGVTQLIRLDCVETGINAERSDRYNVPKIIIVAGQHGGEKCSCYSLYYFLKDLLENWDKDTNLEWIRYHAHLVIIPVANPYGFDHVVYGNANNVNLNRNYEYNWSTYGSGTAPLSEPETQIIARLVRAERSAIYLADYHCQGDGTVLPAAGRPNWHSQLQTYDHVHDSIGTCSKTHIDNISRHWWSEYTFLDPVTYGSCGQVDTGYWESGWPTLQGYASRNGIIANTFEGLNGFTGREGFGAEGAKACTELIGNWVIAVLEHFAKFFDISQQY